MNLNWINKLIKELPEISPVKKNLIEIAGYPKWENVNSNLLAFYFDEKEEHGFNRLFLNSLIDLYESKINVEIERELFEELDITAEFKLMRPLFTINFSFGFDDFYVLRKNIDIDHLKLQDDEVQAIKWASKDEIKRMIKDQEFIPYREIGRASCRERV